MTRDVQTEDADASIIATRLQAYRISHICECTRTQPLCVTADADSRTLTVLLK